MKGRNDVSNYYRIDERYGTLQDFDELIFEARKLKIPARPHGQAGIRDAGLKIGIGEMRRIMNGIPERLFSMAWRMESDRKRRRERSKQRDGSLHTLFTRKIVDWHSGTG